MSEPTDPRQRIIDWREAIDDVLKPAIIALCDRLGCVLVPDHCDLREHDYCQFCGRGRAIAAGKKEEGQ